MSSNPLLSKIVVNPIVRRLPSGGYLYNRGELSDDVVDGEIKIFPLNSLDEIELKSPDLLLSGEGITNVIRRRCPQVLKPEELLTHDLDYILYMMRISSYGSEIEITYTHDCNEKYNKAREELLSSGVLNIDDKDLPKKYEIVEHTYIVNLEEQVSRASVITKSDIDKRFNFPISSGQVVTIIPARFRQFVEYMAELTTEYSIEEFSNIVKILENRLELDDVNDKEGLLETVRRSMPNTATTKKALKIISTIGGDDIREVIGRSIAEINLEIEEKSKTATEIEASNIDKFYSDMITSVDGITDKKLIIEWLSKLNLKDKKLIGEKISKTSEGWGIPSDTKITCQTCSEDIVRELDLNPMSFFS